MPLSSQCLNCELEVHPLSTQFCSTRCTSSYQIWSHENGLEMPCPNCGVYIRSKQVKWIEFGGNRLNFCVGCSGCGYRPFYKRKSKSLIQPGARSNSDSNCPRQDEAGCVDTDAESGDPRTIASLLKRIHVGSTWKKNACAPGQPFVVTEAKEDDDSVIVRGQHEGTTVSETQLARSNLLFWYEPFDQPSLREILVGSSWIKDDCEYEATDFSGFVVFLKRSGTTGDRAEPVHFDTLMKSYRPKEINDIDAIDRYLRIAPTKEEEEKEDGSNPPPPKRRKSKRKREEEATVKRTVIQINSEFQQHRYTVKYEEITEEMREVFRTFTFWTMKTIDHKDEKLMDMLERYNVKLTKWRQDWDKKNNYWSDGLNGIVVLSAELYSFAEIELPESSDSDDEEEEEEGEDTEQEQGDSSPTSLGEQNEVEKGDDPNEATGETDEKAAKKA